MKKRTDIAIEKFSEGYNCAQSVLYSFCDDINIDKDTALKIACGFGSGMGSKEEVCGAVSGGIMVIGAKYGKVKRDDKAAKELTYQKTRELMDQFADKHGSFICRRLLGGCDLTTEEGRKHFTENGLLNKVCKPCVQTSVEMVEKLMGLSENVA